MKWRFPGNSPLAWDVSPVPLQAVSFLLPAYLRPVPILASESLFSQARYAVYLAKSGYEAYYKDFIRYALLLPRLKRPWLCNPHKAPMVL
jgi:hypothetical protein